MEVDRRNMELGVGVGHKHLRGKREEWGEELISKT